VRSDCTLDVDDDPPSIAKPAIGRSIDEILDLATKDRAKGLLRARRLREWLRRLNGSAQAHPDIQEVLQELDVLIRTLRKT
jgi:hypothetical protein